MIFSNANAEIGNKRESKLINVIYLSKPKKCGYFIDTLINIKVFPFDVDSKVNLNGIGGSLSQAKICFSISRTLDEIRNFIGKTTGFKISIYLDQIQLVQLIDRKTLLIKVNEIHEVLQRYDSEGKSFLQLNYIDGRKLLITENLIGFKPVEINQLDMSRIPKVVTTPDLLNVIDALEDVLENQHGRKNDTDMLKKVYLAILKGAENVGFDAASEKELYHNLIIRKIKGSA